MSQLMHSSAGKRVTNLSAQGIYLAEILRLELQHLAFGHISLERANCLHDPLQTLAAGVVL